MKLDQIAPFSKWCRQRACDMQLVEEQDFRNPPMEAALAGIEFEIFLRASILGCLAQEIASKARMDLEALAERLEANAD